MDRSGPRTLGAYELVRPLGRGGSSVVHLARCTKLHREVAIKVLHEGQGDVARLLREARAIGRLRHPNVVTVHEVGCEAGRWFVVFELASGDTLGRRIEAGPLAPREAARIALGLARALECAHGEGLLHRDVKPQNVLLTATGEPLLGDFGLARDVRDVDRKGDLRGTPAYMSPEQARGGRLDARSDVYALGATLHEMLSGRPPFEGHHPVQVIAAVLCEPPAPLPLPAADPLAALVRRCLEKEPAMRPSSAREVALELERYLAPVRATPWRARAVAAAACVAGLALGGGLALSRLWDAGPTVATSIIEAR
jgi:serine/threonine protein kinase